MLPGSVTVGLLVALTEARFGIDVHAAKLVVALSTIVRAAPPARSPNAQFSVCGFDPVIAQPVTAGVSAHVTPPPIGSMSVKVTLFAVPAPVLVSTMVNTAVSPALMV